MSARRLQSEEAGVLWGVRHSQGIKWCDSESSARQDAAEMAARDHMKQRGARGRVRLVRRDLGPLEVVENPYESGDQS